MNIREIGKPEIKSTLVTMDKIFKENERPTAKALVPDFSPEVAAQKFVDNGFRFFSAFENGGEIGTLVLKDNHICVVAVKKYAQKRGVGTTLVKDVLSRYPSGTRFTVNAEENVVPFYIQLGFAPENPSNPVIHEKDINYIPMYLNS